MSIPSDLADALAAQFLIALGHCQLEIDSHLQTLVLIGPDEPAFWPHFRDSPEYADGAANPLDRWSQRVLRTIAQEADAGVLFPSDGPPFHPFQTWALRTGRFWSSPIGFLVHETRGLFASFRGALLLPDGIPDELGAQPCLTCVEKPCKTACPVGAFEDGYDVPACKDHLRKPAGADCMNEGCRARRACPVGQGNRLPAQAAFHMKAFL